MKVTKTGKSRLHNIMDIIHKLNPDEVKAFQKFAKVGQRVTDYGKLFNRLYKLVQGGDRSDEIKLDEIKKWVEDNQHIKNDAGSTIRDLQKKLMKFLGEQYKVKVSDEWHIQVERMLYQLDALMDKGLVEQVKALFEKIEGQIPGDAKIVDEESAVLVRFFAKKFQLYYSPYRVELSKEDELIRKFFNAVKYMLTRSGRNNPPEFEVFETHNEKMVFFQLLGQYYNRLKDYEKEIKSINKAKDELDEVLLNARKNLFDSSGNSELVKLRDTVQYLFDLQICYLNIKAQNSNDAYNDLYHQLWQSGIRGNTDNDRALTMFFYGELFRLNAACNLNSSRPDVGRFAENHRLFVQELFLYVDDDINNFAIRFEMNQAIILFLNGKYAASEKRLLQIEGLKKFDLEVRILRALNALEMNHSDKDQFINSVRKKSIAGSFEIRLAYLLEKVQSWGKDFRYEELRKYPDRMKEIKELAHVDNPCHQLCLYWLRLQLRMDPDHRADIKEANE